MLPQMINLNLPTFSDMQASCFVVITVLTVTGIVLHELAKGKFSMKNFWFRRVRRLFPALVLMLVPLFIVGWWMLMGSTYVYKTSTLLLTR